MGRHPLTGVLFGVAGACVLAAAPVRAVLSDAQKCQTNKMKAARRYATCRLKVEEKLVKTGDAVKYSNGVAKCSERFADLSKGAWMKADAKYTQACPWWGAENAVGWFQAAVTETTDRLAAALGTASTPRGGPLPSCKLPATGQTTSYQSGDDGAVQAGSALALVHAGGIRREGGSSAPDWWNQAILDQRTGLMWEQKNDTNGPGEDATNPRDVDNGYCWNSASCPGDSIADHVEKLNTRCWGDVAQVCTTDSDCNADDFCGYAGYRDWRVPNVRELQSIVDYGRWYPAVDPIFNTDCTDGCTACSCTVSFWNVSASTDANFTTGAWGVHFGNGRVLSVDKATEYYVRAVRGGF